MPERLSREKELELINRMRPDEQQAREELILAHAGLVHGIAASLCRKYGCRDLREELISEGYLKLIAAVDGFDLEKGCPVSKYASQRVWGVMMNLLVKEKFAPPIKFVSLDSPQRDDDDEPGKKFAAPTLSPEEDLIYRERIDLLDSAIKELPEKYRIVIVLHHIDGFSVEEIAQQLGRSTGTVKSQLSRGRGHLRTSLGHLGTTFQEIFEGR